MARSLPDAAKVWRDAVGNASGILISSPEYAHGIPGVLKNALDWLVSSTDFPGKPVAVLGASSISVIAPAQLREILETMNARFVADASVVVPVPGSGMDAMSIATDLELGALLRGAVQRFVSAIESPTARD